MKSSSFMATFVVLTSMIVAQQAQAQMLPGGVLPPQSFVQGMRLPPQGMMRPGMPPQGMMPPGMPPQRMMAATPASFAFAGPAPEYYPTPLAGQQIAGNFCDCERCRPDQGSAWRIWRSFYSAVVRCSDRCLPFKTR